MTGTPRRYGTSEPDLVDATFHVTRYGCYGLTRVYHVDGHVLRVRVHRDFYDFQSHAVAEVLTPQRTWTVVANTAPNHWHDTTPGETADGSPLAALADDLLRRARRILRPLPAADPPDR